MKWFIMLNETLFGILDKNKAYRNAHCKNLINSVNLINYKCHLFQHIMNLMLFSKPNLRLSLIPVYLKKNIR